VISIIYMKNNSISNIIYRIVLYLIGLTFVALGVTFSKMASLGISPVSSIPRALEVAFGFSLGTMVTLEYFILVVAQFIVLTKDFKWVNASGILIAFVFGFIVDLVGIDPNAFGHLLYNFPRPSNYFCSIIYLLASILFIAFGVVVYFKAKLVPLPAEGLANAISVKTGRNFGDCKTYVDTSIIVIAVILQMIFLGGLRSFTGDTIVVREGTIITAIFVGQAVKLIQRLFEKKTPG